MEPTVGNRILDLYWYFYAPYTGQCGGSALLGSRPAIWLSLIILWQGLFSYSMSSILVGAHEVLRSDTYRVLPSSAYWEVFKRHLLAGMRRWLFTWIVFAFVMILYGCMVSLALIVEGVDLDWWGAWQILELCATPLLFLATQVIATTAIILWMLLRRDYKAINCAIFASIFFFILYQAMAWYCTYLPSSWISFNISLLPAFNEIWWHSQSGLMVPRGFPSYPDKLMLVLSIVGFTVVVRSFTFERFLSPMESKEGRTTNA